jgi:hypothetical protein
VPDGCKRAPADLNPILRDEIHRPGALDQVVLDGRARAHVADDDAVLLEAGDEVVLDVRRSGRGLSRTAHQDADAVLAPADRLVADFEDVVVLDGGVRTGLDANAPPDAVAPASPGPVIVSPWMVADTPAPVTSTMAFDPVIASGALITPVGFPTSLMLLLMTTCSM